METPGSRADSIRRDSPFGERPRKMTIGAVCDMLRREFPDISISKIRYLEDQKLLSPRRTQGGYRLYSSTDVSRLRTILRLQRDEFLPLRVIRQELAAGRTAPAESEEVADEGRARRIAVGNASTERHSLDEVLEYSGADERLVRELSLNRANAVKEALVKKYNLQPNQFVVAGFGWDKHADPNDPENHAKNRRVEVKVIPAEAQ